MKRLTFRVVLAALLGLVMSIAVAWGCALWAPDPGLPRLMHDSSWPAPAPEGWQRTATMVRAASGWGITTTEAMGIIETPGRIGGEMQALSAGWPKRALVQETHSPGPAMVAAGTTAAGVGPTSTWHGAWKVNVPTWAHTVSGRTLPFLPRWGGLVVDVGVYGLAAWLALTAFDLAQQWRRKSRGLCPACAYPIPASGPCPECGRETAAEVKAVS